MNVVVGKLGKKFYVKKEKWTIQSGDQEVMACLIPLAYFNKDIKFYVIGKSDICDLTQKEMKEYFPNENVIDIWQYFDKVKYPTIEDHYKFPLEYFNENNIKIDFGFIHAGPIAITNVPNHSYCVTRPSDIAITTVMSTRYGSPMIHFLNESKIKYVVVGDDPRYFPCVAKDLFNRPIKYLSSIDDKKEITYHKEYLTLDCITNTETIENVGYDRFVLTLEQHENRLNYKKYKKDRNIDVYTNFGSIPLAEKKLAIFSEYFLKAFPDSKIFGYWPENSVGEWGSRIDGTPMADMNDQLYRTKYTLMVSYNNKGNPSSKFWKMIWFGIIPFIHKGYDVDNEQPTHPYLRVNTAKELIEKINYLNEHDDFRNEILDFLSDLYIPSYFNGEFLNSCFKKLIAENVGVRIKASDMPENAFRKESSLLTEKKKEPVFFDFI